MNIMHARGIAEEIKMRTFSVRLMPNWKLEEAYRTLRDSKAGDPLRAADERLAGTVRRFINGPR